ncbi:MAG: DMT family transporter, partial [Casimicrobiaceae bacterium]
VRERDRRAGRRVNRGPALLRLHVAVALFGVAALFGRWIELPPTSIVLGRTAFAALALAGALVFRRTAFGRPTLALAINGVILALHWVTFFAAVQATSVAIALIGYASFPLFVVLLERGHGVPGARWGVAALVVAGLLLAIPAGVRGDRASQGLLLGILSGFAFALLVVRNRSLVAHVAPIHIALWQNLIAAVVLVPFALVASGVRAPAPMEWALLALLGIVCTALAHTFFIASMRQVSAHTASIVAALEPVYGIALAAALLAEIPSLRTLAGAALIVAAAIVASHGAIR